MNTLFRLLIVLLAAATTTLAAAQADEITLEPYTDERFAIQSLVPRGWTEVSPGLYARASTQGDLTWIVQQSALIAPDTLLSLVLTQLRLSDRPAPGDTVEAHDLT
jgi:hypothetical protein